MRLHSRQRRCWSSLDDLCGRLFANTAHLPRLHGRSETELSNCALQDIRCRLRIFDLNPRRIAIPEQIPRHVQYPHVAHNVRRSQSIAPYWQRDFSFSTGYSIGNDCNRALAPSLPHFGAIPGNSSQRVFFCATKM